MGKTQEQTKPCRQPRPDEYVTDKKRAEKFEKILAKQRECAEFRAKDSTIRNVNRVEWK